MDNSKKKFLVERTCSFEGRSKDKAVPLKACSDYEAYVLLGDSGAGKTTAFEKEAEAVGGKYVKARTFLNDDLDHEDQSIIWFIDALDEVRVNSGDANAPIDQICRRLKKLNRPRFRLSCRAADWLGASDRDTLRQVSPDQNLPVFHLDPLTQKDVIDILRNNQKGIDAESFVRNAESHGLGDLLFNPQVLHLLITAVGNNQWPENRQRVYEMACAQLARENNDQHRLPRRQTPVEKQKILEAAGYLCATCLLSGNEGYAFDDDYADPSYASAQDVKNPENLPLIDSLKTKLFQEDGINRRIPIHRSVAEYLGARDVAQRINDKGLPLERVLALITSEDGGIANDLRGFAAWLAVHCSDEIDRARLIELDPVGLLLYGDVKNFSATDKKRIFKSLSEEARRDPWFRSDDWSTKQFGGLCTDGMQQEFQEMLAAATYAEADQSFLDCVLDAIRYGEPMPALIAPLDAIIRDRHYWPSLRNHALLGRIHNAPEDSKYLLTLVADIQNSVVEDREDELLGNLLSELYPKHISPEKILEYLHVPKSSNFFGNYCHFFSYELIDVTPSDFVPCLLNQLLQRKTDKDFSPSDLMLTRLVERLLMRGIEEHGDKVGDEVLYVWLGLGLQKNSSISALDADDKKIIAEWFSKRPERYKSFLLCATTREVPSHMYLAFARMQGAEMPTDIGPWYLENAEKATQDEWAEYFFNSAVQRLIAEGGAEELTPVALDFIRRWVDARPRFSHWLTSWISCSLKDWRRESFNSVRNHELELKQKKAERIGYCQMHIEAIRNGQAAHLLHDLANAYKGWLTEAQGTTPQARLENFLDGDLELVAAAHSGFRQSLYRQDLPSVADIVKLATEGRMHYIRTACLLGADEWYQKDSAAFLQLDIAILSRLIAFRLADNTGETPTWFAALARDQSALFAEVLIAYALPMLKEKKEYIATFHELVHNESFANLAQIALPVLLEKFPPRANQQQLQNALDPLMKAALSHMDRQALANLIASKWQSKSLENAQRVYWLALGLITSPEIYGKKLKPTVGTSQVRQELLARFFYSNFPHQAFSLNDFPESVIANLIELLAPSCAPDRINDSHWVTPVMETTNFVLSLIATLGNMVTTKASREINRLLNLPQLEKWHLSLQGALHSQRNEKRKQIRLLDSAEVSRTLLNLQPANAGDLAALVISHLRVLAKLISHDEANQLRWYWKYKDEGQKKIPENSKHENDCRDVLLGQIKKPLAKLKISAEPETWFAEEKRADIKISFLGSRKFTVPIEIKKDSNDDLWKGIHKQLIPQYVRDPDTDGYGIYLVFWFGEGKVKPDLKGKKYGSAKDLEAGLQSTLKPDEKHRIHICVIDCSWPKK